MQKLIWFAALLFFGSTISQLRAQTINNKSWKTYIGAPINDSAILNIYSDSSFITNIKGEVMVRHHCNITADTLTLEDYSTDQQGCPDIKGSYKINLTSDGFTLSPISDLCDGRSHALAGRKWVEAKK